eukprot:gene14551-30975_t
MSIAMTSDGTSEDDQDDASSNDSGILDDDICWKCGESAADPEDFNKLVVCDTCSGDFHLHCVQLRSVPRSSWSCPLCKEEMLQFYSQKFTVSDHFKIPRKRGPSGEILYNPARPLVLAFEECTQRGLMLVQKLLSYNIMSKLTHGVVEQKTSSGRVAEKWLGATKEISNRICSGVCRNMVLRDGRYDITLPKFVVEALQLGEILRPVLELLQTIMAKPCPQIRTHNVVFVPVGSPAQQWHYDDCKVYKGKLHHYFTILVNLNTIDENCGGTELRRKFRREYTHDLIRGRPGDAFVFNGSLEHRGQANTGRMHRFFYYASFACKSDGNTEITKISGKDPRPPIDFKTCYIHKSKGSLIKINYENICLARTSEQILTITVNFKLLKTFEGIHNTLIRSAGLTYISICFIWLRLKER